MIRIYIKNKSNLGGIFKMARLIFGHTNPDTDTVTSAIVMGDLQNKLGIEAKACRLGNINKETEFVLDYFGVEAPELITELKEGSEVILVDHNEFSQSATGIEKAEIKMVVDHHRIANFQTAGPLYFRAEPVGCTATILYKMYKENQIEVEPKMAGLMLSAIVSDTLLLKSPTCTSEDEEACKDLAKIAGVELEVYGLEMLKAGTNIGEYTADGLLNMDSKIFNVGEDAVEIAQINVVSIDDLMERKTELENQMEVLIKEKNLSLFMAVITDIINSDSQVIALGKRADFVETGFKVKLVNNTALLEGIVSRKKQIVPVLDKLA